MVNSKNNVERQCINSYQYCRLRDKVHIFFRIKSFPFFKLEEIFPEEGNFLDFGCGYGILSHLLAIKSQERKVVGTDLSTEKIDVAIKSIQNTTYKDRVKFLVSQDIGNLDSQKVDGILIIDVLYLMSQLSQKELLFKCYQTLKSGGILLIKTMRKNPRWKFYLSYLQEIFSVRILKITRGNKFYFMDEDKLLAILKKAGFGVSIIDLSKGYIYPHTLYLCSK